MKTILRLIMIAIVVGVILGGQNLQEHNAELVRVSYGFGEFDSVPQWQALTVAFALGAVVMFVLMALRLSRSWLVGRRYRKEITRLEKEVHGLRNLPVVEQGPPKADPSVEVAATAGASESAAG